VALTERGILAENSAENEIGTDDPLRRTPRHFTLVAFFRGKLALRLSARRSLIDR